MQQWPTGDVDALLVSILSNDDTIKQAQKVASGPARVSFYRVVKDPKYFHYIYGYSIPGITGRVNGNRVIQFNPDYDLEVRTLGAPTADSETVVDRMIELIGSMKKQLTLNNDWAVSSAMHHEINMIQSGETPDVYFTRRGASLKLSVVRA